MRIYAVLAIVAVFGMCVACGSEGDAESTGELTEPQVGDRSPTPNGAVVCGYTDSIPGAPIYCYPTPVPTHVPTRRGDRR